MREMAGQQVPKVALVETVERKCEVVEVCMHGVLWPEAVSPVKQSVKRNYKVSYVTLGKIL